MGNTLAVQALATTMCLSEDLPPLRTLSCPYDVQSASDRHVQEGQMSYWLVIHLQNVSPLLSQSYVPRVMVPPLWLFPLQ